MPFWSLKPPDEAAAAEEPELTRIMGDEVLALAVPDTLDFDGLFSLITPGDAEVAAAAVFEEYPVCDEVESSEDFDGLFSLITSGDAEVAAAAVFDEYPVCDEVELSEDFDGLFRLITPGDAEVAAAAVFDECPVCDEVESYEDFDGLFRSITPGDAEVAAAFDECPVCDEVELSEQSLEDLSPLRFLEFFPDEVPVAVAVLSLDDADALVFFLLDEDEDDPFADDVLDAPLTPGSDVISVNWLPSLMGPLGFALHEPAGETGLDMPNGIVPVLPTLAPPTNVFGSSPWYWHWNSPLSSEFFGAC